MHLPLNENTAKREVAWDGLSLLTEEAHDNAVQHGFYDDYYEMHNYLVEHGQTRMADNMRRDHILAMLNRITSEIGEATHTIQNRETDKFAEEVADILITTLDLAGFMEPDFQQIVLMKMAKNRGRPYRNGKVC